MIGRSNVRPRALPRAICEATTVAIPGALATVRQVRARDGNVAGYAWSAW